ncbi:MAG: TVP38/TMEM64 family protein, partial [Gemmatimonadota bacterium]
MADVNGETTRTGPPGGEEAEPSAGAEEVRIEEVALEGSPNRKRALLKLAALAALVIGGIALARFTPVGDFLSREGIDRGIELVRGSPWAPALFVLTYGVAMALALPGTVLTLAGGALFGFGWGVVFNTVGANLGANAAFGIARWLGRDGVERLAGDRLEKLDKATKNYGFRGLMTLRLIPLVPFNALNFGAGLTAMSWATYAGATLIGIFPGTVVYTLFADALLQGSQEASREAFLRMLLAGVLLVLLSFLPTIMKKLNIKVTGGTAVVLLALGGLLTPG